ncbi:MAG: hypothetical protein GX597_15030 [Anaerolineaceae bacterium]|nr:hypothetical protein [Anaerolineaceae bacterium]
MSKRKPYVKPEMERIQLVPEEAVLGGCKTTSGGGIGTDFPSGNCVTATPYCVLTIQS